MKQVSVSLNDDLASKLEKEAAQLQISISAYGRLLILRGLRQRDPLLQDSDLSV